MTKGYAMWEDRKDRYDVSKSARATPDGRLPVVVAVSADGYDAGVRFAAAEAVRGGVPLHVVHVLGLDAGSATQAARICFLAVERARDLVGQHVPVTSEIFHGDLIDGLVELSRRARLVVLQRHAVTDHTLPRATSTKVAAHAGVPVVCVPRDWNGRGLGTVTVGVDDTAHCVPLLREALSAARSRGAELRILHVDLPSDECDSERDIRIALAEASAGLEDVPVTIDITVDTTPVAALVEAMATSELLVIGRHHPLVARGSRLGPVARRVVRDASCPVLLLTPSASTSSPDWVFAGHLA